MPLFDDEKCGNPACELNQKNFMSYFLFCIETGWFLAIKIIQNLYFSMQENALYLRANIAERPSIVERANIVEFVYAFEVFTTFLIAFGAVRNSTHFCISLHLNLS
jgi:hypothetical protein